MNLPQRFRQTWLSAMLGGGLDRFSNLDAVVGHDGQLIERQQDRGSGRFSGAEPIVIRACLRIGHTGHRRGRILEGQVVLSLRGKHIQGFDQGLFLVSDLLGER